MLQLHLQLCHKKHAELNLPDDIAEFKGRLVFRGDQIKDEDGYLAVFSEQGASASRLEAAKMMDALARLSLHGDDECDGEDADAALNAIEQLIADRFGEDE